MGWKELFRKKHAPHKSYKVPASVKVPVNEWTPQMSAYVLWISRGKQDIRGSAMDLFRSAEFGMVDGGTDRDRAGLVSGGARYVADFAADGQGKMNVLEFERANPSFVGKVTQAVRYATYGEE